MELEDSENDFYNVLPNKTLQKIYKENGKKLGIDFISDDNLNELTGKYITPFLKYNLYWRIFKQI